MVIYGKFLKRLKLLCNEFILCLEIQLHKYGMGTKK